MVGTFRFVFCFDPSGQQLPLSSFSMTPSQADQLGELGQVDIFMAVCGKSFIADLDVANGSQMLSVEWPKELFYYALLKRGPCNGNGKVSKAGWGSFDCVEIERKNNFLPTLASGVENNYILMSGCCFCGNTIFLSYQQLLLTVFAEKCHIHKLSSTGFAFEL